MRIVEITYHKPANLLVEALQKYCRLLISESQRNCINSLKDIEDGIWRHAEKIQSNFPKCSLEKLEVVSTPIFYMSGTIYYIEVKNL